MIKLVHISSRFIINEFWVFCPARIGIPPHCAAPILTIPNTTDPFFLEVDASDVGLGAALFQRQNNVKRVVAYTSRVLSPEERSRGISYREGLACVFGMEKFRCFLDQVHFTLVTDHMPLTSITRDKDRFGVMTRLALRLQMFDYSVIYKSGAANVIPDYLSRTAQQTAMDSFNQVEGIASTDNGFASEEVHRPVISASRDPEGNGKGQKVWGLEYAPAAASIRLEKEQIVQGSDVGAIVLPVSHVDTMTARNHGGKKSHGRQSGDGAFEFPECQTDSVSELEQCVLVEEGKQSVQCAASNKLCLLGISAKLPPSKVKNKRQTEDEALADIPITFKVDVPTLIDQQRNDPEIDRLCSELENPQDRKLNSRQRKRIRARFRLLSGVLFHSRPAGLRLYVPTELRKDIMRSCHDNPLASHFGIDRTIYKVALKYYWKGMHSQIRAWVRTCEKCQRYKSECRPPRGLQMSTSHDACWADVYTDHFGPLPRSKKGNRYLLVFVCAFSRACELVPVRNARSSHICHPVE